jgi:hypothetical protein
MHGPLGEHLYSARIDEAVDCQETRRKIVKNAAKVEVEYNVLGAEDPGSLTVD